MADLATLQAACAQTGQQSEQEKIRRGEVVWYLGKPASATSGTVALSPGGGFVFVIPDDHVLDVRESDGRYLVAVAADTNVLLRHDRVLKAGSRDTAHSVTTRRVTSRRNDGLVIVVVSVCDYHEFCFPPTWPIVGGQCFHWTTNCTTFPLDW